MMNSPLAQKIKKSLDDSLNQLDGETLEKLNAARRDALNQPSKKSWFQFLRTPAFAGLAFCCVFTIALIPYLSAPNHTENAPLANSDQTAMLELLDEPDDLEALSDPGFYLWLEELEQQGSQKNAA